MINEKEERALAVIIDRRRNNPIRGTEVASAIEMVDRSSGKQGADLRAVIHGLRMNGYPICANDAGYYWPDSKEELQKYLSSFAGRIRSQEEALDGMRNGFDKIVQEPLEVLEQIERPVTHKI